MATTISSSGTGCPLSIEEVLEVLLLCFEAAADSFRPFAFAYAKKIPAWSTPTGISSLIIWTINDIKTNPPSAAELSFLSFPPESLPAALARWNMCDYFAVLLFDEAKKKMQGLFGAQVDWVLADPVPALGLFPPGEKRFVPFCHSVLQITERSGTVSIMDGTPEQFHWSRSTWFLPAVQFAARTRGFFQYVDNAHRSRVEDAMKWRYRGYWKYAQERMDDLLSELDWARLFVLPRDKRVAEVKDQAEAAFAGAWRETCRRAGVGDVLEVDVQVSSH